MPFLRALTQAHFPIALTQAPILMALLFKFSAPGLGRHCWMEMTTTTTVTIMVMVVVVVVVAAVGSW